MPEFIVPFGELSPRQRDALDKRANWKVVGKDGSWDTVTDPRYGVVEHVAVVGDDGVPKFDKLNIKWTPGVYIAAVRINPEGKAEFLLPSERRVLLRDKEGNQGNVFVDSVPQGIIKVWDQEMPHMAALRELAEETGYSDPALVYLGEIALAPANSEVRQPFFLALVPYQQIPLRQTLESTEDITADSTRWFTWQQIESRPWVDGITIITLSLARRVLKPELLRRSQTDL